MANNTNTRLNISEKKLLLLSADFIFVYLTLFFTLIFRSDINITLFKERGYFSLIFMYAGFSVLVFYILNLFNIFVIDFWASVLPKIFFSVLLTILFIIVSSFYLEILALPRISIIWSAVILFIGLALIHYYFIKIKREPLKVVIIGSGFTTLKIIEDLKKSIRNYLDVIGVYDESSRAGIEVVGIKIKGGVKEFSRDIASAPPQMVIVSFDHDLDGEWTDALLNCVRQNVQVCSAVDVYGNLFSKVPSDHIDVLWFLSGVQFIRSYLILKRLIDIIFSVFGLIVLAIVFPFVYLGIKLTSPGPIFFSQVRVGLHGRIFKIYKLRTMIVNAEKSTGPVWCQKKDRRVTLFGRFLRKVRVDELPQFWNIIKGDMSLIGPRPERPEFVEMLKERIPFYNERHLVKPGLTGWAQVLFPYGNTVEDAAEKLHFDLFYIRNISIFMDMKIILKTIATVMLGKGGM